MLHNGYEYTLPLSPITSFFCLFPSSKLLHCAHTVYCTCHITSAVRSYDPFLSQKGWNIACHASAQDNCEVMEWLLNNMSDYGADITSNNEVGGAVHYSAVVMTIYRKDPMLY